MHQQMQMVKDFQDKLQVSPQQDLRLLTKKKHGTINACCSWSAALATTLAAEMQEQKADPDQRLLRAHLLMEELSEVLRALFEADEEQLLDGLADLLYVLLGTAVTFDLPLAEAFEEVHRSNMTKEKQPSDPLNMRVRMKGPNYQPPNLKAILEAHRNVQ